MFKIWRYGQIFSLGFFDYIQKKIYQFFFVNIKTKTEKTTYTNAMSKDTLGSTEKGGRNNISVCHSFRSEDIKYAHKFFMTAIILLLNIMAYMRATQEERERERQRK